MNQNRNTPPDPHDYDMYAAFRTKERGEARRQQNVSRKSSYFDAYARRAEEETAARRRAMAEAAARNRANAAQRPAQGQTTAARQNPGTNRITYGQGLSNNTRPRVRTEVPLPGETPSRRQKAGQDYGTRVINADGDAYRYGYHSSYRTSDGRILDGFDAKGRPIYREEGAGGNAAVIRHTGAVPSADAEPVYRQPRRVRVETLADTDTKPFPFGIILTVVVCTGMIMAVLFAFMKLNEYTNTLSSLTYQLSSLRSKANTLQAELVRREDLLTIEQTASEILGMVKTDVLTKKYVTIENEDKTEVVSKLEEEAHRRTSVEIDLDTGKPMTVQNTGNAYIPPADTTPVTEVPAAPETESVIADAGTGGTDSAEPDDTGTES